MTANTDNQQLREKIESILDDYTALNEGEFKGQTQQWWSFAVEPATKEILALISSSNTEAKIELLEKLLNDWPESYDTENAEFDDGEQTGLDKVRELLEAELKKLKGAVDDNSTH